MSFGVRGLRLLGKYDKTSEFTDASLTVMRSEDPCLVFKDEERDAEEITKRH